MIDLADAELLAVWEQMRQAPLPRRVLALIEAGSAPDAAHLSLGESNRRLLALRNQVFGPSLACVARCEACGERFEFELDGRALASSLQAPLDEAALYVEQDGYALTLALPTLGDCIAAAESGDPDESYRRLLAQCVSGQGPDGVPIAAEGLPEALMDAVDARMEAADPAAEMTLAFDCPACGQAAQAALDLAAFCWAEIEARAPQLLGEVHLLASHYGWSEASVLAMSRVRRQHYLELVLS